jgi:hypothetical protein
MACTRLTVVLGLVSGCVFGCSSDSDTASSACNSLVADGPTLPYTSVAAAAPTPAGGTIADGTYALATMSVYTGVNGSTAPVLTSTVSVVMAFAGNTVQEVTVMNGQERRYSAIFSVSGTTITMTDTCPVQGAEPPIQFTASATELRLYATTSGFPAEAILAKR